MRQRKLERCDKRQRGQFMTPRRLAHDIVERLDLRDVQRVLEPSCGDGSFLEALLRRLLNDPAAQSDQRQHTHGITLVGLEIDPVLLDRCKGLVDAACIGTEHICCRLLQGDFFRLFIERMLPDSTGRRPSPLAETFDLIIGNPPFGGSFDPELEDHLDALLGTRFGSKIKKETYAFFIVACTELLRPGGRLLFICSDSLLTIPTMTGLRQYLMRCGAVTLHKLEEFSVETNYPMLVLDFEQGTASGVLHRFGRDVRERDIEATPNLSWGVTPDVAKLFHGPKLGDFFVASSGMTTGKNDYFVRKISRDNTICEPFQFRLYDAPISVAYELERARLRKLPRKRLAELREAELRGDTERRVVIEPRDPPTTISLPHEDYRPYNKANGQIVYSPPCHVIFWKDDGEAVLTYKRTGNWYLRGVGGQPFFGREGLTWQLVASRFVPRYLPPGYILDSGAPCAFTRDGVDRSEIFFVIGWLLTPLANRILKTAINHTMNIQSKDLERMPYPWWVPASTKAQATEYVVQMVEEGRTGRRWTWSDPKVKQLATLYEVNESFADSCSAESPWVARLPLDRIIQPSLFGSVTRQCGHSTIP